ncbi:MAG: radical SAM protein [Candidatus Omnitrophota bacterium]
MRDDFRIDAHKLMFHVGRVHDWLRQKAICPIYLEIAPAGICNHRCIFCAVDYLDYKPDFLDPEVLKKTVKQAADMGVKSIMYAGEGEPLLNKNMDQIVPFTKKCGIDVAITTNGVLLKKDLSLKILKHLSWIRFSFNAGTPKTYAKVHRSQASDFHKVITNIKDAVRIKKLQGLKTTIGVQLLLIPENIKEVFTLAALMKKIGVDYLTIKPYSQHPLSKSRISPGFKYKDYLFLKKRLDMLENSRFKIIFRTDTMERLNAPKDYKYCYGLPFWAYINAKGDVYACSAFLGKKEFCYGNIYKNTFKGIIRSRRRKEILNMAGSKLDITKCREVCRLDKINTYLWELKHPGPHVNFI